MNAASFFLMVPPEGGGGGGAVSTLIMFGAIGLIFYFMIIRPQSKRMKQHRELVASIKKGDRVTMNGGLHGRVHEVRETTVLVEIARNTIAEFERGSIQGVKKEEEAS